MSDFKLTIDITEHGIEKWHIQSALTSLGGASSG